MEIIVVMHNIRSCYNVGAILRTCEGFGVSKVFLSGYTPRIHDRKLLPHLREKLDKEIHKTALGAEDLLDICACDDIFTEIKTLSDNGWQVIGLENNINKPLSVLGSVQFKEKLSNKVVLVLGEEVNGIDKSLYDVIDIFVEIPMSGKKESFNVSVAAGIALYGIINS
ncbi:TrmH family RNA methyltransferase [Candidatus Saccharibacteria bacterium]|nr:TrmH family RNA methyltransferase [Candidatus Saccharibacteria bacterium]